MDGATVALASYKGRPLVVNFWATWCAPCKLEIPWFIEFKQQFGSQGLEILGVSIDDPAAELKTFAAKYPDVPPATILQMATINGAQALGRRGELGELSPNALADLIAIPFTGKSSDAHDAVVHHTGAVAASMIDGRWAIAPRA